MFINVYIYIYIYINVGIANISGNELLIDPMTSPKLLSSFVCSLQWVKLSRRPLLSCFHRVCAFILDEFDAVVRPLPIYTTLIL